MDPRNYQILSLSAFILFGVNELGFQIQLDNAVAIVFAALFTQYCLIGRLYIHNFDRIGYSRWSFVGQYINDAKSALISSLSLVLLLRTDMVIVAALTAFLAIASKRFFRFNGSHFLNPSACALVLVTLLSSHAYISPGQWGALGLTAFAVIGAGLLVVTRAHRLDVALAFLLMFATILFARGWYLGDPVAIAWHQMQNGALLLFTFFMITDPKTTPVTFVGRISFGFLVAGLTAILQFYFYLSAAPIYALVALAPLVPLINLYSRKKTHVKEITDFSRIADTVRL